MRSWTEGDSERGEATSCLSEGILSGREVLADLRGGFEDGSGRIGKRVVAGSVKFLWWLLRDCLVRALVIVGQRAQLLGHVDAIVDGG